MEPIPLYALNQQDAYLPFLPDVSQQEGDTCVHHTIASIMQYRLKSLGYWGNVGVKQISIPLPGPVSIKIEEGHYGDDELGWLLNWIKANGVWFVPAASDLPRVLTYISGWSFFNVADTEMAAAEILHELWNNNPIGITVPMTFKLSVLTGDEDDVYDANDGNLSDVHTQKRDPEGLKPFDERLTDVSHTMMCIGIGRNQFGWYLLVMNSWGKEWGDKGFGYVYLSIVESAFKIDDIIFSK